jgi:hypothetical protein
VEEVEAVEECFASDEIGDSTADCTTDDVARSGRRAPTHQEVRIDWHGTDFSWFADRQRWPWPGLGGLEMVIAER